MKSFAQSASYLSFFAQASQIPVAVADAELEMFQHPSMEHMFLALVTVYQERFPENFKKLDARNFILPAAFMAFHDKNEELGRLQQLVEGNRILQAGVEEGIDRASKLKADTAILNMVGDPPQAEKSDLAQRPHDTALVPARK